MLPRNPFKPAFFYQSVSGGLSTKSFSAARAMARPCISEAAFDGVGYGSAETLAG